MNPIPIVQIKYGSHLYGTSTPASDLDIKGIYLPEARDILLQQIKPIISFKRPKQHGEKNKPEDVDYELYSPERFLSLLAEGQTMALDMLFAPDSAMLAEPRPEWREIQKLAPKLFTKQAASFVRYCRQQANKYGIKGSRVAASRLAVEFLTQIEAKYGTAAKLSMAETELRELAKDNEFLLLGEAEEKNGDKIQYLDICGKKALFKASIKSARAMAERLMHEYGDRALAAEKNEGIDWKALSHAVRVAHEAIEFLTTQHITFPRPEAAHLLDIKLGKLPFQEVGEQIENLLLDVEEAVVKSKLSDSFDQKIIDDFLYGLHKKQIA